jgi:LEA14-like dessication related protein
VEVVINNPNWYRVLLTDSDIDVYLNGKKIGRIQLKEKIILPRKTLNTRTILMKGDYEAMESSFLESILTVLFASSSKVKVDGYMKGRAFFVSRKVDVMLEKDIDLREFQQDMN